MIQTSPDNKENYIVKLVKKYTVENPRFNTEKPSKELQKKSFHYLLVSLFVVDEHKD